jgi:hypothetical protein
MTAALATTSSPGPTPAPGVVGCGGTDAMKIRRAWAEAAQLAELALAHLLAIARGKSPRDAWNTGPARASFGPFRRPRLRRIARVYAEARRRLREGYDHRGRRRPALVECLRDAGRCRDGLLGNASVYGRIRLCPRLLERRVAEIAAVILHEVMHHRLAVGDQRHEDCVGDRKNRCYRDNARVLVRGGNYRLAARNIDNLVLFARTVAGQR